MGITPLYLGTSMTQFQRELIGRAAMVLLALLLFAGAFGLGKSAAWMSAEERREEIERPRRPMERRTRVAGALWTACFVVGAGGLGLMIVAVLPNRVIYRFRPKPPVLHENPEPNYLHRWF